MRYCAGEIGGHALLPASKNIIRVDLETLAVLSDVDSVLVSVQRLSHVQRIFSFRRHACWIIRVIFDHCAKRRIAHALVHFDGIAVAPPHEKIHKPGILLVTCLFKRLAQEFTISEPSILRCY